MESILVQKEINIENKYFNIQKTIPLKPIEMFNFLIKYLPFEKDKRNHPDFKHIFDYLDSIKQYNEYYLLSMISIPQCPLNINGLGNFFGQKMNNITKDLKIFPFGNAVISNISLVSKRTTNHRTLIILSLKGNKKFNDYHPSNPYPINNLKNSVGYFLVDSWTNTVCKRYINYLYDNGLKQCVDEIFLKYKTNNKDINKKENENEKDMNENETDMNENEKDMNENEKDMNENEKDKDMNEKDKDMNLTAENDNKNDIEEILKNMQKASDIINSSLQPINIDNKYYKYQFEIINLKNMIFYLINNKGIINNDFFNIFSNELIKGVFGEDYKIFMK